MIRKTHAKSIDARNPAVPVTPVAASAKLIATPDLSRGGLWRQLFGIDIRSLAFFRIALALSLLADLVMRAVDVEAFYTDAGTMPRALVHTMWNSSVSWTPYLWFDSAAGIGACLGINALFLLALLVGWNTRFTSVVCWVLLGFIHARNPFILQGGDVVLRCMMFWAMFLPLGSYFSLDAKKASLPRLPGDDPKKPVYAFSFGTVAALLQVCFIYWFAALLKSDPSWWNNGYAIYVALNIDLLTRPLGTYLKDVPFVAYILTFVTIYMEAFGPFLAFFPLRNGPVRTAAVFLFWAFHLVALQSMMYLGPFPWSCAMAWTLFLPSWFWDTLAVWWKRGTDGSLRRRLSAWSQAYLPARIDASGKDTARRPVSLSLPILGNILAAFYLVVVIAWNMRTVNFGAMVHWLPPKYDIVTQAPHLDQCWDMFSPKPMTSDGWYIIVGRLRNGKIVDFMPYLAAYGDPTTASWDKPAQPGEQFRDERWRKYFLNMFPSNNAVFRPYLLKYIANRWNRDHKGEDEVCWLELEYMLEETPDQYAPIPKPVPMMLCRYACFPEFELKKGAPIPPPTVR